MLDGGAGAYTNVLALASSVDDYMAVTAPALLREGLLAVGVDNPEPLRERKSRVRLSAEIPGLEERARTGDVVWDTFHVFDAEAEEG